MSKPHNNFTKSKKSLALEQVIKDFHPIMSGQESRLMQTQQLDMKKLNTNTLGHVMKVSTPQGALKPNIEKALEKVILGKR